MRFPCVCACVLVFAFSRRDGSVWGWALLMMRPCASCACVRCVRLRSWSVACPPFPLRLSLCRVLRVSAFPVSDLNFTPTAEGGRSSAAYRAMLPPGEGPSQTQTTHTARPPSNAPRCPLGERRTSGYPVRRKGGGSYNPVEFEQALVGYSQGGHLPQRGVSGASGTFFFRIGTCKCSTPHAHTPAGPWQHSSDACRVRVSVK